MTTKTRTLSQTSFLPAAEEDQPQAALPLEIDQKQGEPVAASLARALLAYESREIVIQRLQLAGIDLLTAKEMLA